jgi:hypothetical protein
MAKLIKNTEDRPTSEFLVAAPCSVDKFQVTGEPGAWEVEIPDEREFAVTHALAFGGWTLKSPAVWVGNFILNFNGITKFKFHAGEPVAEIPHEDVATEAPEPDIQAMKKKLTDAGVKFHHFAKADRLAKLIEENGL